MATARQSRGRDSQRIAAEYLRANGFPHAEPVWGSQPGRDITGLVGLAPEVKAVAHPGDALLKGLPQAARNARGDLPWVLWRPNGYGLNRVEDWVMAFTFRNGVRLLRDAGFGDPQ